MKKHHDSSPPGSALRIFWVAGILIGLAAGSFLLFYQPQPAQATSSFLAAARTQYPTITGTFLESCALCHTNVPSLNPYGADYRNHSYNFAAIESLDSDNDGFNNITEINAHTFPGNSASQPGGNPTSTPTPAGGCTSAELIQDGGFEAGLPNPAWQTSSNVFSNILDDLPDPPPHSGTWKAWMGGDDLVQESLWQTVTVPADAANLEISYWWRVNTFETSHPFDTLEAQIRDTAGNPLQTLQTLTDGNAGSTWQRSTFTVSDYAGQTIQLAFVAQTDETNPTSFFLDDVSMLATCAPSPTATPTSTSTPTATPTPTSTSTLTATPTATGSAPTATPTTPAPTPTAVTISKVRVTDARDTTFTVSWITDQPADGQVHYGTDPTQLNQGVTDSRVDDTHLVVVKNLNPETTYYFDVVSGESRDNNGGSHYQATTGPTISPAAPYTAYGYVYKQDGTTPAEGTLVYGVIRDGDGQGTTTCVSLVAQVDADGTANFNLANARTLDLTAACQYSASGDTLELTVEGGSNGSASRSIDTGAVSPWAPITLSSLDTWHLPIILGWNFLALPGEPASSSYTAQSLLDEINQQGGQVVELARWENSGWESHIDGQPFNNFPVELGRAYFLRAAGASTWTLQGHRVTQPVPLQLTTGWNGVGFPEPGTANQASDLCAAAPTAEEIARWENSGWESHLCGQTFNNFDLETERGYFVRTSGSATWPAGVSVNRPPQPAAKPVLSPIEVAVRALAQPAPPPAAASLVRVSNVRDTTFTVSWVTDLQSVGQVRYGTSPDSLDQVADDVRGADTRSATHYVTVSNLASDTTYYFDVLSGNSVDDNNGQHYQVTTGPTLSPAPPHTTFGQVFQVDESTPANGAIVYLQVVNRDSTGSAGESALLSALVQSGYWAIDVNGARTPDLNSYFTSSKQGDHIALHIQGDADAMAYTEAVLDKTTTAAMTPLPLNPCAGQGDVTCNCQVSTADLQSMTPHWRSILVHYDVDQDGRVTVADVARIATQLGTSCSATLAVSDPGELK